jgi:hypothetical protein
MGKIGAWGTKGVLRRAAKRAAAGDNDDSDDEIALGRFSAECMAGQLPTWRVFDDTQSGNLGDVMGTRDDVRGVLQRLCDQVRRGETPDLERAMGIDDEAAAQPGAFAAAR